MKRILAFVLFAEVVFNAAAVNSFTPLDIDKDNRLLFNITDDSNSFDSLFLAGIEEMVGSVRNRIVSGGSGELKLPIVLPIETAEAIKE